MKLTLEIINSFNLKKETYKPDYDDAGYEFILPSGIRLVGFFMINGEPCDTDCLEGLDGYIYIDTKEELTELVSLSNKELLNKVDKENPNFDINEWL